MQMHKDPWKTTVTPSILITPYLSFSTLSLPLHPKASHTSTHNYTPQHLPWRQLPPRPPLKPFGSTEPANPNTPPNSVSWIKGRHHPQLKSHCRIQTTHPLIVRRPSDHLRQQEWLWTMTKHSRSTTVTTMRDSCPLPEPNLLNNPSSTPHPTASDVPPLKDQLQPPPNAHNQTPRPFRTGFTPRSEAEHAISHHNSHKPTTGKFSYQPRRHTDTPRPGPHHIIPN